MEIVQSGKIDPILESIALFHAVGKKVDNKSLQLFLKNSGGEKSDIDQKILDEIASLFNKFGEFAEVVGDIFLKYPAGYKNPLLDAVPNYDEEALKTALNQYSIIVMLTMATNMSIEFNKMTEKMEERLGPASKSEENLKQGAVDLLQKIGKRETFDPYLHAALVSYGSDKQITPAKIEIVLNALGIKSDPERLEKICGLINNTNMPEITKAQLMYVKSVGD